MVGETRCQRGDREVAEMLRLEELIDADESAIRRIHRWVAGAETNVEVLPPSADRDRVLLALQVSTRFPLGAIAYDTGGIFVDDGWLRVLGSGHVRLSRNAADWSAGRGGDFCLVADDAAGGFFAVHGRALGDAAAAVHYWAPDNLDWEPLGFGFADFFQWSLTSCLADFYQHLRWPTWRKDVAQMGGDRCCVFSPFLWTKEGSLRASSRRFLPVAEAFALKADAARQLRGQSET